MTEEAFLDTKVSTGSRLCQAHVDDENQKEAFLIALNGGEPWKLPWYRRLYDESHADDRTTEVTPPELSEEEKQEMLEQLEHVKSLQARGI